jgi:hypothetical protein
MGNSRNTGQDEKVLSSPGSGLGFIRQVLALPWEGLGEVMRAGMGCSGIDARSALDWGEAGDG